MIQYEDKSDKLSHIKIDPTKTETSISGKTLRPSRIIGGNKTHRRLPRPLRKNQEIYHHDGKKIINKNSIRALKKLDMSHNNS